MWKQWKQSYKLLIIKDLQNGQMETKRKQNGNKAAVPTLLFIKLIQVIKKMNKEKSQ